MKNILIIIIAIVVVGGGFYFFSNTSEETKEELEEQISDAPLAADSLVGVWQSIEDPKFFRTIYENGQFMDTYEGQEGATSEGPYVTFTADNAPENFTHSTREGGRYLELKDEAAGSLFFEIAELREDRLALIYLDGNGVLEFIRVTE